MKKLTALALAAAFVAASSAPASAIDVKMDGEYLYQFQTGSIGFGGANEDSHQQRVRLGMTFTASEALSGYFQTEALWEWGGVENEMGQGVLGVHPEIGLRQAYIDWKIPGTDVQVRMGRHAFDLPSYASTSVQIADMVADGIAVAVPFNDTYSMTAFWARPGRAGSADTSLSDELDIYGVIGSAGFEKFTVTPWLLYVSKNDDADNDGVLAEILSSQGNITGEGRADSVIFGTGFEWKPFDPVTLALDAAYGTTRYSADEDQEGWYAVAKASYGLSFGEPGLRVWYSSGDDANEPMHSGQAPIVFGDYDGTSSYFNAACGIFGGNRSMFGGTWGVSAMLNGVSFVDGLSHDFVVSYFAGTNDKANGGYSEAGYDYLTTEDSAVEFDFVSTYEIYKNLTAILEMSYIVEDFATSADGGAFASRPDSYDNDWRVAMHFQFTF